MIEVISLTTKVKRISTVCILLIIGLILLGCTERSVESQEQFVRKIVPYIGDWHSNIATGPGQTAPIILHFKQVENQAVAALDSPNQNAFDIPLTPVASLPEELVLINTELELELKVSLSKANLFGELSVGQHRFEVDFSRYSKVDEFSPVDEREQTPKPPYSYDIEELQITSSGQTLAGTLTIPQGVGPFPAVVLISGSGPDNRNYSKFGHHRYWVVADHLVKMGIAVLRYDERGVGDSGGDYDSVDFSVLVNDVNRIVSVLSDNERLDSNKIGVIGHSEGAMIASIAAASNESIGFTALLGAMHDYELGLSLQYKNIANDLALDEREFIEAIKSLEQLAVNNATAQELYEFYKRHFAHDLPLPEQLLRFTAEHFTSKVMKSFLSYQPDIYLSQLKGSVFIACGTLDQYFDCEHHMQKAQSVLAMNPNTTAVSKVYPNLNHYFQSARTGKIAEEPSLSETISTQVLSDLSQWILQQK